MKSACRFLATWLLLVFHLPTADAQFAQTPTVTISNGVVVGTQNALQGQERFLAIPYAQAPTGTNRLRPPQAITSNFGTLTATESPSACPQFALTIGNDRTVKIAPTRSREVFDFLKPSPTNNIHPEDCLLLNVQRPAGLTATSKLPVLFWIWGGAWQNGGVSPNYDVAQWLGKAISLKEPFIFVGFNYRLGAFGFLPGKQMADEGATNLGLRDQRAALEWVADNIAAFGGDPERVTLFGNSGGAWCVLDQTIINRGDHTYKGKPLFRGAILSSGAILPSLDNTHPKGQKTFDDMAKAAGCDPSSADVVECLRKADFEVFLNAQNSLRRPNNVINLSYLARPDNTSDFFPLSREDALTKGEFAKVPIIAGNQQDEGAFWGILLTDVNGNNDTEVVELFNPLYPDTPNASLRAFIETHPRDLSAGCPYNTGIVNEISPGFKRLSSLIGDLVMTMSRRIYLDTVASQVKTWSYLATYDHGTPVIGTCHSTDMLAIWFGIASPFAVDQLFTRFTSFISHLDPNALNPLLYADWPQYDTTDRKMLSIDQAGTSSLKDNFRDASYKVLKRIYTQVRM